MPLELRKDIERIQKNLGHASVDQLEKLFRDANVSDDAVSALKHFRCDACDRLNTIHQKENWQRIMQRPSMTLCPWT